MRHKQQEGYVNGPAISDAEGNVLTTSQLDTQLIEILEDIFVEKRSLFPPSISTKDDIGTSYMVYRSLRRSSATRALEENVSKTDIDIANRWHTVEQAKGNVPQLQMQQRYAQVELMVTPFLRYTGAMWQK
jgi:hypothetical protein